MNCTRCGHENPDDAKICESCSFEFNLTKKLKLKKKTNKEAAFSFFLACISPYTFMITSIPSIFLGFISLRKIKNNKEELKGELIAKAGIALSVFFLIILLLWRTDAPPIKNDYTINDIKSANPENNKTFELLQSITGDFDKSTTMYGRGVFGQMGYINKLFSNNENDLQAISDGIKEKAQEIITMWENAKQDREILKELDSFPEIADLAKPEIVKIRLRYGSIFPLYRAYISLQSIEGNHEQALKELNLMDSVTKKMALNTRDITTKLVCDACFDIEYFVMNFMVNDPDTPNDILLKIRNQVDSISVEQTSLKNSLTFEYLRIKNELGKMKDTPNLKYHPMRALKYNSTLRFFRNYFDERIAQDENRNIDSKMKVWPFIYPDIPVKINSLGKLNSIYYRIYNPAGYVLIDLVIPAFNKVCLTHATLLIRSDMLKIALNSRLGQNVDLKARAYSNEYIIDIESKKIFSPGPDGIKNTQDDISLPINPEVLGYTKGSD